MAKNNITNKELIVLGVVAVIVYLLLTVINQNPSVLPEAGYCIEKNLPVQTTTMELNGSKESIEYCALDSFCEAHYESTIIKGSGDSFDESGITDFVTAQEGQGLSCFTDYARTTKRLSKLPVADGEELITKFACCTTNNLESDNCPGNTCGGRYTGYLDSDGCRIYAVPTGTNSDGYLTITTCGGDPSSINNQQLIEE